MINANRHLGGLRSKFSIGALRPATNKALGVSFVNGFLDPRITFTRASTGTYFDAAGVMQTAAVDAPRFDYNPVTLQPKGLLIEGERTNVLLGSAAPVTQNVTVTAQIYTLSFYGTGSIALSGVFVGNLAGTGATNRVTLAFTPTAGTLTLTIAGSVTLGQLEAEAFASSYIATTASSVTRAADVAVMTGANFSSWYNASQGTFIAEASTVSDASAGVFAAQNAGVTHFMRVARQFSKATALVNTAGVDQASLNTANDFVSGSISKTALTYAANDFALALNGGAIVSDAAGTVPTVDRLIIGAGGFSTPLFGHVRHLDYYNTRLPNAELQRLAT